VSGGRVTHSHPFNRHIEPSVNIKNINKRLVSNKSSKNEQIDSVFDYWKKISCHPRSKLDSKRKNAITNALKNYSVDELKLAVDGCIKTEFNRNHGYDDIELICRNSVKTDRFIVLATNTDKKSVTGNKSCMSWVMKNLEKMEKENKPNGKVKNGN